MKGNKELNVGHQMEGGIALLGDVALNGLFCSDRTKNTSRFQSISKHLKNCDLVFANLETPVIGASRTFSESKKVNKGILHYTEKEVLSHSLDLLNISVVSLANNHIFDCGIDGVKETIACLDKMGILHTGAGLVKKDIAPVFMDMNGVMIGMIAYVDRSTNPSIPDNSGIYINYYSEKTILKDIKNTVKLCDKLFLSLHWGPDYSFYPYSYQLEAVNKFVEAGVDVIIGHHSHTVQPHEMIGYSMVFYSLGSFCYGDYLENGKIRALRLKTKRGYVPILNKEMNLAKEIFTKELKGNRIKLTQRDCNKFRLIFMRLVHRSKLMFKILLFKEAVFDRLHDYFFGYYRNPLKQIFSISNFRKIGFIKQDFNRGKSK